ncbi:MAG: COX15/CtaA family protein [Candidatus Zixiibacteriota bacterium]
MKSFRRFAVFTTLTTFFLIFTGGLVRVSGAGLGCPDWPKCFGRWFPPLSYRQLPADFDPNLFNFTLAWIEYINRLVGVIVGLLIAVLALWALFKFYRKGKILYPSILAGLLVAFQGWQGGQVVLSELAPFLVSIHLLIAYLIAGLMIYISQQAFYYEKPEYETKAGYPGWSKILVGFLLGLIIAQAVIGTQMREAIELAIQNYPLLNNSEVISKIGAIKYSHPIIGLIVALLSWVIAYTILKRSPNPSPLAWQSAWTMAGLALLQVAFGLVLIFGGLPDVFQAMHLWLAGLLGGTVLIALSALGKTAEE